MQSRSEAASDALQLLGILSMLDSSIFPLQVFENAWYGGRKVYRANSTEESDIFDITKSHVSQLPAFVIADGDEWDSYRLTEARELLASLSLVTQHDLDCSPGLSMHPLTHAWAKDRQDSEEQGIAWIAAGCVLALSRINDHTLQIQERRLLPHVQTFIDTRINREVSLGSKPIVIPILFQSGWALEDMRQDSKLSRLLNDMFVELGKKPDEFSDEFLALYVLQARNLSNLGFNRKAVKLLEQVVRIREATLAEDDPGRLMLQHDLAIAYQNNGQIKEAVKLLEHMVKIGETTQAKDNLSWLSSQHALGSAYRGNGQVKEAVRLLEQVVKIREATLAKDHPNQLASQYALGIAYRATGQVKEAVELLEQVVKIRETTLAKDHPDQLASQHELGIAYRANGQGKKAVELFKQVIKIREATLAEDNPYLLASQHSLAVAYGSNGQINEAFELLEQVVKIKEATLAKDHPSRLVSEKALAYCRQEILL